MPEISDRSVAIAHSEAAQDSTLWGVHKAVGAQACGWVAEGMLRSAAKFLRHIHGDATAFALISEQVDLMVEDRRVAEARAGRIATPDALKGKA